MTAVLIVMFFSAALLFHPNCRSRAVCFEIGHVDHHRLPNCRLGCQPFHHPGEDAHVAKLLPVVVEGRRWGVFFRRVASPQVIAIGRYYFNQLARVIYAQPTMALWKKRSKPHHLNFAQPVKRALVES